MESYKDKHASLIVFGIFEILGGAFCAFLFLITCLTFAIQSNELVGMQAYAGLMFYAFAAAWLITMGIGTLRARRWAQRLMLAGNWLMLTAGILAMGMFAYIYPKTLSAMSPESRGIFMVFMFGFLAFVYLVLPGIGILFYGNRNVRATVEHRDDVLSWTEKCPLPILVLALMYFGAVLSLGSLAFMNFALPLFGAIVSGWIGAIVLFVVMCICLVLMVGTYQMRMVAWWCSMVLIVVSAISQLITYSRIDVNDYYVAMGYSDKMLEMMQNSGWDQGAAFGWMAVYYAVPMLVYLILIKRFFNGELKGEEHV